MWYTLSNLLRLAALAIAITACFLTGKKRLNLVLILLATALFIVSLIN